MVDAATPVNQTIIQGVNMVHSLLFSSQFSCYFNLYGCTENSADPDQMASSESTLFSKENIYGFSKTNIYSLYSCFNLLSNKRKSMFKSGITRCLNMGLNLKILLELFA